MSAPPTLAAAAVRLSGVMARLAGWTPDALWQATPAEVAAVLAAWSDGEGAGPGFDRAALDALMEQFPDG